MIITSVPSKYSSNVRRYQRLGASNAERSEITQMYQQSKSEKEHGHCTPIYRAAQHTSSYRITIMASTPINVSYKVC
jgi:hypothetical protein